MVEYCSAEDVRRILSANFNFSSSTLPTEGDINSFIEEAEAEIEEITQHAWRTKTVTNEFYDIPTNERYSLETGLPIKLNHRAILDLTSGTDKVELWDGSVYSDWLVDQTQGRANDFWLDNTKGVLYLRRQWNYNRNKALRMTYRYGESSVPSNIRQAAAIHAAILVVAFDDNSAVLDETGDPTRSTHDQRIIHLRARIKSLLKNKQEFGIVR